jgi:hypothetical protein
VYSRSFDTQVADRSTNGVDILLAALEDKRIEVSLHVAAKAQAAQTFKQPTPGKGDGGNPDRPTPRSDKNLKNKEKREKDKTRKHKEPEPEAEGLMVCTAAPILATLPPTAYDIACDGVGASGRKSARACKPYSGSGREYRYRSKTTAHPHDSTKEYRYWTLPLPN